MSPHTPWTRRAACAGVLALAATAVTAFGDDKPGPKSPYFDPGRTAPRHWPEKIRADMLAAPELTLTKNGDPSRVFAQPGQDEHPVLKDLDSRTDLKGLPVLRGDECKLKSGLAKDYEARAKSLRSTFLDLQRLHALSTGPNSEVGKSLSRIDPDDEAGLLTQMLQCESDPMRKLLIEKLGRGHGPAASVALAKRAVFETDAQLRELAVTRLRDIQTDDARQFLLGALRHPYPAFADFASAALISLKDREVLPALADLLDEPSPTEPAADGDGRKMVREVVRINHFRNCQLCHAPSWNEKDAVRARVPSPDKPLPSSFSVKYYEPGDQAIVRADVTYLRQDFSLTLPVENAGQWPKQQRFDFFVRERPAKPGELKPARKTDWHRAAVLRTLRGITGKDYGENGGDWRKRLAS